MVPAPATHPVAPFGFGHLVGAAGDSVAWGRLLVFFAALCLSDLVGLVLEPLIRGHGLPRFLFLLSVLFGNVVLTGVVLGAFRWIRSPFLAAPVATVVFVLIMLPIRFLLFELPVGMPEPWRFFLYIQWNSLVWTFLFLLGLVAAVALIRRVWLALLVGAVAAQVVASFVLALLAVVLLGERFTSLVEWVGSLARAAIFAAIFAGAFWGAFWGGLQLPWAGAPESWAPAAGAAGPERMSKAFYVGSLAGAVGLITVLGVTAVALAARHREAAYALVGLAALLGLYGGVVNLVLWYKAWEAIQDGHARTTPGKAIGFLFIPFFNFYWAFQALWGWAKDYNAYLNRHSLNLPRMPEGLFLAYTIVVIASVIPVLGWLASLAALVLVVVLAAKICDGVNALSAA